MHHDATRKPAVRAALAERVHDRDGYPPAAMLRRAPWLLGLLAAVGLGACGGSAPSSSSPPPAASGSSAAPPSPSASTASPSPTGAASGELKRLIQLGQPIYCGGSRGNAVAFTFDDGPGPYTHFALKKLRLSGQQATFFTVGRSIDNFPGWLHRERPFGVIGDHTTTHPVLTQLSDSEIEFQIAQTKSKIETQTGQPVDLFRPPYGARNTTVDSTAQRLGLLEILWNIDSADSLGANYAGITRNVEAGLHPGSIILMHENRGQTIRALTTILPELQRRHLRSVTVPQLLQSDPPSEAQVRAGVNGCSTALRQGSGA